MLTCNGLCSRYPAKKLTKEESLYANNIYCKTCNSFLHRSIADGYICKCCKSSVRIKAKQSRSRHYRKVMLYQDVMA